MLKLDNQISGRSILAVNKAWCLEGVQVQNICIVGCRLPPLDGYVVVCLVLTIELSEAVVVAQLVEWSLIIPEVCSLNQVIGKNLH